MANPTDSELKELLKYHFSYPTLKEFARAAGDAAFKSKSKLETVEYIVKKIPTAKILTFVFEYFHASRHNTYIFELCESGQFKPLVLKKGVAEFRPETGAFEHFTHGQDGHSFNIMATAKVNAQQLDPKTFEVTGKMKTLSFLLPIRVAFCPPKHLKIKLFKFAPGKDHALASGEVIHINEVIFDELAMINYLQPEVIRKAYSEELIESNLVSGMKALIQSKKINAIVASADDEDNEGEDKRTKHKTKNGQFLEERWLNERLLKSDKIKRGKWFWVDGENLKHAQPAKLKSLTIDPCAGLIAKDSATDEDLEWFIDEVIKRNS